MILFLRTSDIQIDSRLLRYARALDHAGIPHAAAFWSRGKIAASDPGFPVFRFIIPRRSPRRRTMLIPLLRANLFFMATVWRERRRISLLHAVDLDTALSAWIMRRLTGVPYIYDVYDHYADSRGLGGRLRDLLGRVEALIFRDAACVILADDARRDQHGPTPPDRLMVVENVPEAAQGETAMTAATPRLKIGYLGTFEPLYRGLEDLIAAVEGNAGLELEIAGSGALEAEIAAAAARCDRIRLHPPLAHRAGLEMLAQCDIVAGLYYSAQPNHRFAAPNKYYEHLLVGRPLLTSVATPPGQKVAEHDTGWAVEDGPEPVAAALADALADRAAVARKGRHAAALWRGRFTDYFAHKLRGEYVATVHAARRDRAA
jgi:glycosyltransferase involved in cell wall biosynthesis